MHVWRHPIPSQPGDILPPVSDAYLVQSEEERVLAEALAGWRDRFLDVSVDPRVVHGRIRRTVIDATSQAQLVVVGSRGGGGFAGLLLGSVSQAVLHHAACPLVIVPTAR